ncbi:glutaredoxin [Peptoniphilus equinus]|uniref:Glutaredoxin n=1 Tax=Peptoniphilus equinus TaxID=3016343 RepID=A0ABY7QTK6_9FIRM|nr:glutaredoxin [Peptoniphilus equinus]WBW49330.1 glutaredoxin [Peptoniphilus equinus]
MNILYYSSLCPDTMPAESKLEAEGVVYEKRDITANLTYMKEFLSLRDRELIFEKVKSQGQIGIPLLVTDTGELRLKFE